jgi:hypothetical protein
VPSACGEVVWAGLGVEETAPWVLVGWTASEVASQPGLHWAHSACPLSGGDFGGSLPGNPSPMRARGGSRRGTTQAWLRKEKSFQAFPAGWVCW